MEIYVDVGISFFDFLIIIVLFWAIYRGYTRGAIIHSVALLVLLGGIGISAHLSYVIYGWIQEKARVPLYNLPVILFFFMAVASIIGSHIVARKVIGNIGKTPKGKWNRGLGVLVNVVKYLYMISIAFIMIYKLDANYHFIHQKEKSRTSLFYPIMSIAPTTFRPLRFREIHPIPIGKPADVKRMEEIQEDLDDF